MAIALLAVLLYILVSKYAEPGTEKRNQWRILGLVVLVILIEALAQAISKSDIVVMAATIVSALALFVMLMKWLGVPRPNALKITLIFTGIRIALGIALAIVLPGA